MLPGAEKEPLAQLVQVAVPGLMAKVLALQGRQLWPGAGENWPGGQGLQPPGAPAALKNPAEQLSGAVALAQKLLAGQGRHVFLSANCPGAQRAHAAALPALTAEEVVPGGHRLHAALASPAHRPGPHCVQSARAVALAKEEVPAGQGWGGSQGEG